MSNILDEERAREFAEDVKWLHSNYNDLINTFNGQFVAIRNKTIIDHDENIDRLKEKLKQKGVETATILVEFIRDKRNQID
jgi:hypothetical protein